MALQELCGILRGNSFKAIAFRFVSRGHDALDSDAVAQCVEMSEALESGGG
jgi:hypothetical protein